MAVKNVLKKLKKIPITTPEEEIVGLLETYLSPLSLKCLKKDNPAFKDLALKEFDSLMALLTKGKISYFDKFEHIIQPPQREFMQFMPGHIEKYKNTLKIIDTIITQLKTTLENQHPTKSSFQQQ